MTLTARMRWGTVLVLASAAILYAGDKKDKPAGAKQIDSGSFGIFVKGQRVVTETFSIEQSNGNTVIKAHLKETSGADQTAQKSSLEITSSGELIRYEWSASTGDSLVLLPDNEILIEKITTPSSLKPVEQRFILPSVSPILDNNFFVHREVLAWHYLQVAPCSGEGSTRQCQPLDFGAVVPQSRVSMPVRLELVGREKVLIRGTERELLRLNLKGDEFTWALWLDDKDQFKLMRVLIPDDNTEVVRD